MKHLLALCALLFCLASAAMARPVIEQDPYGQPYGQPTTGQPYGQDPYGQQPPYQDPYGQQPYGAAPAYPNAGYPMPQNQQNTPPPVDPVKNKVVVTAAGQTLWNGAPVDLVTLRQYLDLTQQMNPVPELHLQPEANARYELVDQVLAVTKRAHVEKMGFVGNEAYGTF